MKRNKALVILACLLCWWPLPAGIGYLFLGRWQKFVITVIALQIGAITLALMLFGNTGGKVAAALVLVAVVLDTLREANARWKELRREEEKWQDRISRQDGRSSR